jgi:hypothetical protein
MFTTVARLVWMGERLALALTCDLTSNPLLARVNSCAHASPARTMRLLQQLKYKQQC